MDPLWCPDYVNICMQWLPSWHPAVYSRQRALIPQSHPGLRPYCNRTATSFSTSQCGRGRPHKTPYGRTSRFSRSAEFGNVQNSLLRLFDRSAVGLLSVCARTARTVVAVRSPNAAVHSHTALTARDL